MTQLNIDKKAAGITIGAHILLLLLCLLIGYTLPAAPAPIEELGMEVNLGNSADGYGTDQAFSTESPATQPEQKSAHTQAEESDIPSNLATDETDLDAASIKTNSERNNKPRSNDNTKTTATSNTPKPKLLFPNQNGKGGNAAQTNQAGGNEGDGTGEGDKGVPGGTAGAKNYSGIPGTGGIGHNFSNRTMVAKPNPDAEFREGGKVVIRVTVNKDGLIVNKSIKSASNPELRKIALEKLEKVRFNKSEIAPPEQFGDITFVFKTRTK